MYRRLTIVCLLLLTSCGGGSDRSPSAPTAPPFATGTWQGPFTTDTGGLVGTLRLVLTQNTSNGNISGTATLTLPSVSVPSGEVTGGVQPGAAPPVDVGLAIRVSGPCPATLAAPSRFTNATSLEGKVAGGNPVCNVDIAGSFALQKQQ
jgi:hypothetical protein